MPGRKYSTATYRYGFNGKENDNEATAAGDGLQDYGMRIYNPSLGRFLSIDPIAMKYPFKTPYDFAENTPILGTDIDGLELNPEHKPAKLLAKGANALSYKLEEVNTVAKITNDYQTQVYMGVAKWVVNGLYGLSIMGGGVDPQPMATTIPPCGGVAPYTQEQKKEQKALAKMHEAQPFEADVDKIFNGDVSEKVVGTLNIGSAFVPYLTEEGTVLQYRRDMTYWPSPKTNIHSGTKSTIQLTKKTFGHTFVNHGDNVTNFILNRAKGSGSSQGQFLDNQKAAQFILDNLNKTKNGKIDIPIPDGFPARIVMPDGTFENPTHIRIVPSSTGVKTAYPIIL